MIIHSSKAAFILCLLTSSTMPVTKSAQNSFFYSKSKEELLFEAIKNNNVKEVCSLLEDGASLNTLNEHGDSPLHLAVKCGCSIEIINLLLEKGADINMSNNYGYSPLHLAVRSGCSMEIINLLLEKGADINIKEKNGDSPLHLAVRHRCGMEIINLLLGKGADINIKDENGDSPLHLAVRPGYSIQIINLLLGKGADINMSNNYGYSPLSLAVNLGCDSLTEVKLLIENGANVSMLNSREYTHLHLALEMVGFLVKRSTNVNPKKYNSNLMISCLLENDAAPNKVFDYLRSNLKHLPAKVEQFKIDYMKTILDMFETSHFYAEKVQTITAGYIRTQSEQEGLYVPRDISSIISKHTYGKSIPLKPDIKTLESILLFLVMIKT